MKTGKVLELIPEYPSAVSEVVLAYLLGLIRRPYGWPQIAAGLEKLETVLSWAALEDRTLMRRADLLQESTVQWLDAHGRQDLRRALQKEAGTDLFGYYSRGRKR